MFESAELGHKIDKETFRREEPILREALLEAQLGLAEKKDFPVIIVMTGIDGAGKGETIHLLNEWMDPRHIETISMDKPSEEELDRPYMWRFWRVLPPKGKTAIFLDSWYLPAILDRAYGRIKNADLDQAMDRVCRFEKMLTNEGALVLKFWMHLPKQEQKKCFKKLEKDKNTRWRVTKADWDHHSQYENIRRVAEHALRQTSSVEAPWTVIEGTDPAYRSLCLGNILLQNLKRRLEVTEAPIPTVSLPPVLTAIDDLLILRTLDLSLSLEKSDYKQELEKYQGKLNLLTRDPDFKNISVVVVFEGNDAAGKGGAIRRVTGALDARQYRVIQIAAPTEEERAQPYLWRFWRKLPRRGKIAIFDRSWYGRVLVERVEEFCSESDWMRSYGEINNFEEQLVRHKTVVAKFWLSISKEEQLNRFESRQSVDFKRFKITDEDWRNREKWDAYEHAACDMIDRTSSVIAPWTLVEANDKRFARIKVLKTLCARIEEALRSSS